MAASGQVRPLRATGQPYRGINVLLLWIEAQASGFVSPSWMTYRQAQAMGAQVRKGEKAVLCAHFERKAARETEGDADDSRADRAAQGAETGETSETRRGGFLMCMPFWVFNVAQIDGLPADLLGTAEQVRPEFDPVEAAEQVLQASGAVIRHGFDGAFYQPGRDEICMPERARFHSAAEYYATGVHELTHWTGHESRLNRTFGKRFGDDAYAFEELVAELGAAYTMGALGLVDTVIEGHAAYLDHWLKVLKSDKTAIFTAAKQAGLAHEFIMNKAEQARQAQAQ